MSSSDLLAGRPRFLYTFCLVDIDGLHFALSSGRRGVWQQFFKYILLSLRIHDVMKFAANKSSASRVAPTV